MSNYKSLYLVSDADTDKYKDNRLNFFQNSYPVDITEKEGDYFVAVNEIFIDHDFRDSFVPKNPAVAPIILTSTVIKSFAPDGKISFSQYNDYFPKHHRIFLPRIQEATAEKLLDTLKITRESAVVDWELASFPYIWSQSGGNFYLGAFSSENKLEKFQSSKPYSLLIFKDLAELLCKDGVASGNSIEVLCEYKAEIVKIDNFEYYLFTPHDTTGVCFKVNMAATFHSYFTPFFYIQCSATEPTNVNGYLKPYIFNTTLHENRYLTKYETDQYSLFHCAVKHPFFYKLRGDSVNSLSIAIVDKNGKPLQFSRGRGTIIHLLLTSKLPKEMSSTFMITVTSESMPGFEDNTNGKFSMSLHDPIQLLPGTSYECALVSATFGTRFKLPFNARNRVMFFELYNVATSTNAESMRKYVTVEFPESLHSLEECVSIINNKFDDPNDVIAKRNTTTGALEIVSRNYKMKMYISDEFFRFLGGADVKEDLTSIVTITRPPNIPYIFKYQIHFNYVHPGSLFVYFNAIENSYLAGQRLQILRIVPTKFSNFGVSRKDVSHVHTHNFESLMFYKIEQNFISRLDFEIRTQSGDIAPFINYEDSPTVLNLLFKRTK